MTSANPFENPGAAKVKGRRAVTGNSAVEAADLPDDTATTTPTEDSAIFSDVVRQLPGIPVTLVPSPPVGDNKPRAHDETDDADDVSVEEDSGDVGDDDEDKASSAIWSSPPFPSIEEDWAYETLEYEGHKLGVRIPTSQALTGFTMATGQYVPDLIKQNMVSLFVNKHFSPQSYAFLMMKLMDPDADEFNEETFGSLVRQLVEKAGERALAAAEEKTAAAAKAKKAQKRSSR